MAGEAVAIRVSPARRGGVAARSARGRLRRRMPSSKRCANAVGQHFGKLGDNVWRLKSRLFRKVECVRV